MSPKQVFIGTITQGHIAWESMWRYGVGGSASADTLTFARMYGPHFYYPSKSHSLIGSLIFSAVTELGAREKRNRT